VKFKFRGLKTVILGGVLVVGIAIGALGIYYSTANADSDYVFPKNQFGQTYGSEEKATSPETVPDLIAAVGVGGVNGYIKRTDDKQPLPKTLQEAIALNKYNEAHPTREIPLYAVDGKTVIGKYIVGGGTVTEFKTPAEAQKYNNEHQPTK
jgi:hypothetical protein